MDIKIKYIEDVLRQRLSCVREVMKVCNDTVSIAYYEGKADGYEQAIDLLSATIESIRVELE